MSFVLYVLFPAVFNMSLTASIMIAVVLLARLPLKKAPKIFSYALWAVVLFRLLCPVSISAGFSLLGALEAPVKEASSVMSSVEYVQPELIYGEYPQADPPLSDTGEVINEALSPVNEPSVAPVPLITCIWLAGILAMLVYSAVSLIRLRRKLTGSVPLSGNIYLADYISCPFVMGVARPKIYLPSSLPEKELTYIILHEQHHIRRLDHVVKALAFAALCIHWFNPLVWAAFVLAGKDMEMSCDEAVVKKLGEEIRADYSASLLRLATGRRVIAGMPLAFGEGDTRSRIKNLLSWKKPTVRISLTAAAVCAAVLVLCSANPVSAEPGSADPDASNAASDTLLPEWEGAESSLAVPQPASEDGNDLPALGDPIDHPQAEASPSLPAQDGDPEPEASPSPSAETDIHTAVTEDRQAEQSEPPDTKTFSAADVEFSDWALTPSADAMTYEERLAWVQADPVYDKDTYYVPLGDYCEGEDCLAYLGQWVGVPHAAQYSLRIRFADGTEAPLPLPRATFFGSAPPDFMEFQNGKLVYEIYFAEESTTINDGPYLIHLKGTYHYEVDLAAKTVSLSIL